MKRIIIFLILFSFQCMAQSWNHESGINVIIVSGNEKIKTENFKHLSVFDINDIKIQLKGEYLNSLDSEIWSILSRLDKNIYFISQEWLGDNPKRSNSDLGVKYNNYEFGYRLQRENKVNTHFFRFYAEFSKTMKQYESKITFEILPSVLDIKNIQTNIEPTFSISFNNMFSLKISYLYKFDNKPGLAGERIDTIYKTTLVAKY